MTHTDEKSVLTSMQLYDLLIWHSWMYLKSNCIWYIYLIGQEFLCFESTFRELLKRRRNGSVTPLFLLEKPNQVNGNLNLLIILTPKDS